MGGNKGSGIMGERFMKLMDQAKVQMDDFILKTWAKISVKCECLNL